MNPYINCFGPELPLPQQDFPMEPPSPDLCNRTHPDALFDPKDANLTEEQLRHKYLGPRRSSFFIPVCVIYLLIFAVGAVGNTLTCIVILRHRFMRTPTNYYLFSLAVSDLLVLLLGMPLELYDMWSNYPFLLGAGGCYFKTLLFEAVCFASILNVTALSVERYIAVVHPLKAKYVVTRNHAKRVIITIWVVSVICSIPNTSIHGLQALYVPGRGRVPDSEICTLVKPRLTYNLIIQITTIVFFFLPMGTISILYLLIGLQLKKEKMLEALGAKSSGDSDYHRVRGQKKVKRRQVTKMLCVFFYLSSAANPILYNLMSTRFREMFKEVMCHPGQRPPSSCKHSPSVTHATTRSTECEPIPSANGLPLSDAEEYEMEEMEEEMEMEGGRAVTRATSLC
uniref:Neuromedin U receptor 1 n=1 Tax=Gallus gallus TaxID=9031 RepID=A0A8V0YZK7_CHICK